MLVRTILLAAWIAASAWADSSSLITGDSLNCFNRFDGGVIVTTVPVSGMSFARALRVKTGAVSATANSWDIRPRCFATQAAKKDDVVAATFWMRTISSPDGRGFTSLVLERNDSPYTKSVTYTASAGPEWKQFEVPFTMAETYAANGYNFSFWVTYANQEVEIGGISILDYGPGVPFSQLGLSTWPYAERAADAPWRAAAASRIERYRKGDLAVTVRDDAGRPIAGADVRVKMKRHAFGFGTAVAGDIIQSTSPDGQKYREALKKYFNKVVTENALKWPPFESYGKAQADYMLPWFTSNGFGDVRGHNVIWPGASYLPTDVQNMLKASPVNTAALRSRINKHIADVMGYSRGKVTEWDVLNEPYTNRDLQNVLGEDEMVSWFQQARAADPGVKLYINDYNILEAGGYDLQHINGFTAIIRTLLAAGAPIDGIGLQSHFDSNLTPPSRVLELIDQFAAFGKDLQVTEFDISVADEQVQADYTRDFLTLCFSHPAMRGFMIWGFWEGAHWRPAAAMLRRDWSSKPAADAWQDLIFRQWWTDLRGATGSDGAFRARGFLGNYDVEVTVNGVTTTYPLTLGSNTQPAFVNIGKTVAGTIAANGIVNAASYRGASIAPGEIVTIFGSGFGPPGLAGAQYADGQLPTSVGETRVLFDGVAAPMIYAGSGQVSAIVPYSVKGTAQVQVEYQGVATPAISMPVAAAVPGIFACSNKPSVAVMINASSGGTISCNDDFVPPAPGSVVTFFVTGDGIPAPAIADGRLPTGPAYPAPPSWSVSFGGVDAPRCSATFAGVVYAGVTQVNVCVPEGVPRTAAVQVSFQAGAAQNATAAIDLQPRWKLVWSDEFNATAGTGVDRANWDFDLGGGGWGNNELEVYTNSTENVFHDGAGNLVIRAVKGGTGYASARIKTQGKRTFQYGRVEARIKIPYGQGIWPAFWMLGADIGSAGWPACGEIDIMENIGKEPGTVHATVHGPGYSGGAGIGGPLNLSGERFADNYHVYAVEWSPDAATFFVDGVQYFEVTPAKLPAGKSWVFQHPFFLILNVAVGGGWPGNPDATTVFPQQMLVDWVRFSQRQ